MAVKIVLKEIIFECETRDEREATIKEYEGKGWEVSATWETPNWDKNGNRTGKLDWRLRMERRN